MPERTSGILPVYLMRKQKINVGDLILFRNEEDKKIINVGYVINRTLSWCAAEKREWFELSIWLNNDNDPVVELWVEESILAHPNSFEIIPCSK